MKSLPPVLIVTDRGRLLAFRNAENNGLQLISATEFDEGNRKLSEMVTDQAGAFPNTGSIGTSAAERLPLVAEMEVRCFRKISAAIHEVLVAEKPAGWGLAAPSEIHGAIVDHLDPAARQSLSQNVHKDLVNSSTDKIQAAFQSAAQG